MDVRTFKPLPVIDDPRPYQVDILNKAIKDNVIVYLGTGTGKTLIAVLLVKHMLEKEMEFVRTQKMINGIDVQPRICFFLVTTVPLVFQQGSVLQSNLSANTGKYCGEMGVDYWDASKWAKELATHNVIVCTAKIMENLLHMAYVTMDKINLIIFDECHNAVKNSPYTSIMRNFYFTTPVDKRPKILGLTASPINSGLEYNEAKIHTILRSLMATLDCRVLSSTSSEDIAKYVPVASEHLLEYDPCRKAKEIAGRLNSMLYSYPNVKNDVELILDYVGVWGLQYYFSRIKFDKYKNENQPNLDEDPIPLILEMSKQYLSHPTGETIDIHSDISSKLYSLVYLLKRAHSETPPEYNFCGIVFVKRRLIAYLVNLALSHIPDLQGVIKSSALVGHERSSKKGVPDLEGFEGMSFREQCDMIGRFRKHELNLLIATSLLEEGLDVQSCRLVVRYDIPETLIAHVQSRGRARHHQSQYVISVERFNPATLAFITQLKKMEESMQTLRRDSNRPIEKEETLEIVPMQYVVPSTKAVLTYPSSLEKIHQFCATLPKDQLARLTPVFTLILDSQHGYQYKLTLPANCAIREVEGIIHRQKLVAKQSAAYCACMELHKAKLLNDHLLPLRPAKEFKIKDDNSKLGSRKSVREYNVGQPAEFSIPFVLAGPTTSVYLSEIPISGPATVIETRFGIISRSPLPPAGFRARINAHERWVQVQPSTELQITPEQYTAAHTFHTLLFSQLFRSSLFEPSFAKAKDHTLPYMLVPLAQDGKVDWPIVSRAMLPLETALEWIRKGNNLEKAVIVHTIEYQRKYLVDTVRKDLTVNTPLPSSTKSRSLADKMNRRFRASFTDMTQPLLEIIKITNPREVVTAQQDPSLKPRAKCMPFAAPEYCHVLPFSVSLYFSALSLPSILHYYESCVRAHEIISHLTLAAPSDTTWIQALTCSNVNTKTNYQRLEFLGDSVLKYLLSRHLFLTNPNLHEGLLSEMRAHLCCNRFLFERAVEKNLFRYIASQTLSMRGWYPDKPRTAPISDKTIADCVESLIGASFIMAKTTQEQEINAMYTAVKFDFPLDHLTYSCDLANILANQKDQNHFTLSKFSRDVLGYEFKHPFLLIASFTHASLLQTMGDCYQRLEFLGDAIADLLIVRYLYDKYTDIDPGALTSLKVAVVSNKTFSLLSYYHGMYKYIEHNSSTLVSILNEFSKYVRGELLEKELTLQDISDLINDPECDPPKILSDIFEALVAAIYLDCNMDLDKVWEVLKRLVLPFMETYVRPGSHSNPISKFTEMCQQARCQNFTFSPIKPEADENGEYDENENGLLGWTIKLHGHVIANAYAHNKKTAKVMAAQNAITLLTVKNPGLLYSLCDCRNIQSQQQEQQKEKQDLDEDD